ncbi:MAG: hypothetical protein CVV51_02675 [Spirochaetae bacterium HGW-Spirochaetae-7]|jgi:hypothetical protein|nr:MAG: hypothetical protein CVV51_02675 [Spirochaetae bacterium HGW-Spirochaetae-7]
MNRRAILVFLLVTSLAGINAETRSESIDFVLLIDTSLSMADAMSGAREFAAGEIVGRLVEPGDWVAIVRFYGKSEIVWKGDVSGEADIATMVRSLNDLKADGRYTDIGAALDSMDSLILERGHPERPKYILLLSDERQEAPKGSSYYSTDYVVHHPLLEYVKRVDKGLFRVITIGYGLSAKVEGEARSLMTTLSEPPVRPQFPLAGGAADGSDASGAANGGQGAEAAEAGTLPQGTAGSGGSADASTAAGGAAGLFSGAPIAAGLAAAAALGLLVAVFLARRRKNRSKEEENAAKGRGT